MGHTAQAFIRTAWTKAEPSAVVPIIYTCASTSQDHCIVQYKLSQSPVATNKQDVFVLVVTPL